MIDPRIKNINSRPVEEDLTPVDKDAITKTLADDVTIPSQDITDDNREAVSKLNDTCNDRYKYYNAQSTKVREAQQALRQHHKGNGASNNTYTTLSNALNTATQEMNAAKTDYEISKANYDNSKKDFGKKVTF